jgi:hypothetical protein
MLRQFAIDNKIKNGNEYIEYIDLDIDKPIKAPSEYNVFYATSNTFDIAASACANCPAYGTQKPFGKYSRWLITWNDGKRIEQPVEVKRTKCDDCVKTHAVLPDTAVPYMQYSLLFVLSVI